MDRPFARSLEKARYDRRLAHSVLDRRSERSPWPAADLDLTCGSDQVSKTVVYLEPRVIGSKCRVQETTLIASCRKCLLFVECHDNDVHSISLVLCGELYVTLLYLRLRYASLRLLYVPAPPVLFVVAYCLSRIGMAVTKSLQLLERNN